MLTRIMRPLRDDERQERLRAQRLPQSHRLLELFERGTGLAGEPETDGGARPPGRDPEQHPVALGQLLGVLVQRAALLEPLGEDRHPRRVRRDVRLGERADRIRSEACGRASAASSRRDHAASRLTRPATAPCRDG